MGDGTSAAGGFISNWVGNGTRLSGSSPAGLTCAKTCEGVIAGITNTTLGPTRPRS